MGLRQLRFSVGLGLCAGESSLLGAWFLCCVTGDGGSTMEHTLSLSAQSCFLHLCPQGLIPEYLEIKNWTLDSISEPAAQRAVLGQDLGCLFSRWHQSGASVKVTRGTWVCGIFIWMFSENISLNTYKKIYRTTRKTNYIEIWLLKYVLSCEIVSILFLLHYQSRSSSTHTNHNNFEALKVIIHISG